MSCLWMYLSVLCVTTLKQSSASSEVSNQGVSLECNKTVEVVAGEMVTLYCTYLERHCKGLRYLWRNTHGDIPCNSDLMKYNHQWDNLIYVSITISNVVKEEKYTVDIETNCGTVESSAIKVQVQQQSISTHEVSDPGVTSPEVSSPEVSNPGVSSSEVSNPGVSNPGVTSPEVSSPGVSSPEVSSPGVTSPGVTSPEVADPGVISPGVSIPGVSNPGVTSPEVSSPGVSNPGVTSPEVSSPGVSLECNKTVEVVAGETVTLYCTYLEQHCKGLRYLWNNTQGIIPCNSDLMKYSCKYNNNNNLTYVSLTISNVTAEENYTIDIETDCETVESSAIKVQLKQQTNSTHGETGSEQLTKLPVAPTVLRMFTLIVLAVLFFLFGTERGRKIVKLTKKEKILDQSEDSPTA